MYSYYDINRGRVFLFWISHTKVVCMNFSGNNVLILMEKKTGIY